MKKYKDFTLGYSFILHSFFSYLLYAATASTGLNVIVPLFANKNGLDQGSVLSMNTFGTLFSAVFVLFSGKLILEKGIRFTTTISAIGAGIFGFYLMGFTTSLIGFAICSLFIQGLVYGYSYTATTALITNWWPRKKGIVMGITTTGIESAALTLVPLMSIISIKFGYLPMIWFLGSLLVMFGIVSWFWIRDKPEDVGMFPDNKQLADHEKVSYFHKELTSYESQELWTFKKILSRKESWYLILSYGIFTMIASGVASTTIPFAMESGFTRSAAFNALSIACISSIIGSIVSGYGDTIFGPRITTIASGAWAFFSFMMLFIIPGKIGTWVFLIMIFVTMGATGNLLASLISDIYGRNNFTQVFRVIYTGVYIVRGFAFLILGVGADILGEYRSVYIFFGGLSIIATAVLIPVKEKGDYWRVKA